MASDLGWKVIAQSLNEDQAVTYQVFWAKYVFWVVAFPTIVISLGLASGVSWATIVYNVFLSWIWYVPIFPLYMNLSFVTYTTTPGSSPTLSQPLL
jgi:bacteriorhodopsin